MSEAENRKVILELDDMAKKYDNGDGVDKNPSKAKYWYRKAADNGLEIAKKALKNF